MNMFVVHWTLIARDAILCSDIGLLEELEEQIRFVEERIAASTLEELQAWLLMIMTSVGNFTSMFLLPEICIINPAHERGPVAKEAPPLPDSLGGTQHSGIARKDGFIMSSWERSCWESHILEAATLCGRA